MASSIAKQQIFVHQRKQIWSLLYRNLKARDQVDPQNYGKSVNTAGEPILNLTEAREQYVREQTKEILFEISNKKVPKGIYMSSAIMSVPLFAIMGYVMLSAPFAANPELVNPATF